MKNSTIPDMNEFFGTRRQADHSDRDRFAWGPDDVQVIPAQVSQSPKPVQLPKSVKKRSTGSYIADVLKRRKKAHDQIRHMYAGIETGHGQLLLHPFVSEARSLGHPYPIVELTKKDYEAARTSYPLKPPKSEADWKRYRHDLENHPLYQSVMRNVKRIKHYSPASVMNIGGEKKIQSDAMKYSLGQMVGHDWASNMPKDNYHAIYEDLIHQPDFPYARMKIHQRAIDQTFNPDARALPGQEKHFVMVIGGPGSGKTESGLIEAKKIVPRHTMINVDDNRLFFPEYHGWDSTPTHLETALLTYGHLMPKAIENNHHLVYDATGSNYNTMAETLKLMRDNGYTNHLILVNRPSYEAAHGAWERFDHNAYGVRHPHKDPSRFVDPVWIHETIGNGPHKTYEKIKKNASHLIDHFMKVKPKTATENHAIEEEGYVKH